MKTIQINSDNPNKEYKVSISIQFSDQIPAQILDCISYLTNLLYQDKEGKNPCNFIRSNDVNNWLTETMKRADCGPAVELYMTLDYANYLSPADEATFRILRDNQGNPVFREALRQADEARRTGILELGRKKDGYDASSH